LPLTYSGSLPFDFIDSVLKNNEWRLLIAKISDAYVDSECEAVKHQTTFLMSEEVELAVHYGFEGLLLASPMQACYNYAHILHKVY
jgi:hypothetical protein